MGSRKHDEIERKFDVAHETIFPTLSDVDGVSAVSQPADQELVAVYFDTAGLDLARHGMTLRRRTGGDDAGWHLKVPQAQDTRTEHRLPLGRATKSVPKGLLAPVRAIVRDRRLSPVARVSTRRREYTLVDGESTALAKVCDDAVEAERLDSQGDVLAWREWEVELVDGDQGVLEAIEARLLDVGAMKASADSKLGRVLGDDAVPVAPPKVSRKRLARGSAGQLVRTHFAELAARLQEQDTRLRTGQPGSIHKLRIAARRSRTALKTYKPLLVPGSADTLGDELRWLGQALADARDAQVLRERLQLLVASEPPELLLGPVMNRIDDELRRDYQAGLDKALGTLDSERYYRLLDAMDDFVASTPLVPEAEAPARKVLPQLLQRDGKRLRRVVKDIGRPEDPAQHDAALHEARKKAKRLRYAAESARPALGKRAKQLAASAKNVQQALGQHQDSVVARQRLREYGVKAYVDGENGFSFGRLHALEQQHAQEAEQEFRAAWKALPGGKLHRWLRT